MEAPSLVDRVDALLRAWDRAFALRDTATVERLTAELESIIWTPEFIEEVRSSKLSDRGDEKGWPRSSG